MKFIKILLIILLFHSKAFALIEVDITRGNLSPLPIAISPLSADKKTLSELGYNTVDFRIGNGRDGWQEYAPFHAIIVTAASETTPLALVDQLDDGGRMVIPRGPQGGSQNLILLTKDENGIVTENEILPVSFVPLVK